MVHTVKMFGCIHVSHIHKRAIFYILPYELFQTKYIYLNYDDDRLYYY